MEEYLGDISLDGEQSVQLNGKPTQQAYCAPGKMTDFYRVSQFGMMFKPLMESLGEELLMSYQADFHAKTYPQQEGGGGIEAERSGMWKEMARIIGEVRPRYAFVENSPMLTSRGLGTVLADLAQLGFDAEWGVLSAADVGANHKRERIWILAYSKLHGFSAPQVDRGIKKTIRQKSARQNNSFNFEGASGISTTKSNVAYTINKGLQGGLFGWEDSQRKSELGYIGCGSSTYGQSKQGWWATEPNVGRVANGVACRVDRIKALGNGQVPICAATAWKLLKERLDGHKQRGMEKHL